jgi:hypothetical protein
MKNLLANFFEGNAGVLKRDSSISFACFLFPFWASPFATAPFPFIVVVTLPFFGGELGRRHSSTEFSPLGNIVFGLISLFSSAILHDAIISAGEDEELLDKSVAGSIPSFYLSKIG